jgi:hypothetical protein
MSLALPLRVETADDDNNGARRDRVEQPAIVPRRALIRLAFSDAGSEIERGPGPSVTGRFYGCINRCFDGVSAPCKS